MPKWEIGKTYKTVNGCDAKLVARLNLSRSPLLFVITKPGGSQEPVRRNDQGTFLGASNNYEYNVVPPEPVKTSQFVTAYSLDQRIGWIYSSLEQARRAAIPTQLKAVLEIQYEDDELVNVVIHPAKEEESK